VPNRSVRLSVALFLVVVGLRWIVNTNPWSGPTVLELSATHGVHLNDWVSLVCWAAAGLLVWPRLATTPIPALLRRDRGR
jgi:Mg2+/citrate symporter